MKIGYQGEKGAYSEAAMYNHYGNDVEAIGYETFEDVFDAVKNNKIDYGFLPFENTIAGSVVINYDLVLKEDVFIVAEVFFKITHSLLSHKGNKLENIKKAYSHPHSLAQCREFLKKYKIDAIPEYDTAGAAKIVKERNKKEESAIASELCAEIYGLEVIKRGIETNKHNTTKFFAFVKKDKIPKDLKKEKTSIVFKTKHYPGALINCLQRLSKNNINLTKLESRPSKRNAWEYVFFVEFDGGLSEPGVQKALQELGEHTSFVKIFGSYSKIGE